MARPPINDGLDELGDAELIDLGEEHGIGRPYLRIYQQTGELNERQRNSLIRDLRRKKIASPYSRQTQEPSTSMGLPAHPADTDIEEYQHIQRLVDARYDTEGGHVEAWRVRLTSGNEIVIYSPVNGAIDVENQGFTVMPLEDDDMVSVEAQQHEQVTRSYETPALPRRPPPKLPARRIGKHQQGEVVSLDEQRSKPARGEPSLPFGYESEQKVSHFPRHRRRQ